METSNNTFKVIGALFVGALVGATIGVLFAPEKGSKTRKKLIGGAKDLAEDLKNKVNDEIDALKNKAQELEEMAEEKLSSLKNGVKEKADTLLNKN